MKMQLSSHHNVLFLLLLTHLTLLATTVTAGGGHSHSQEGCTCPLDDPHHHDDSDPKSVTLTYRIISIFIILLAGTAGILIPIIAKRIPSLKPGSDLFFMIKAFAAGVIIATAFIHIIPEAFLSLTSPCLKAEVWDFPWTGFIAMLGAIGSLMIDSSATGYFRRVHFGKVKLLNEQSDVTARRIADDEAHGGAAAGHAHTHTHGVGGDVDQSSSAGKLSVIRHRVTSQVLEMGIMVHSIIIGITIGTSQSVETIKTLMAALCFHQFFEGMGLGGCIVQAMFKTRAMVTMVAFFALTTPIGIVIGIGVSDIYSENSPTALIVQGTLDAAAGGILVYMALVDLLAPDFLSERVLGNSRLQMGCNISLLLGACCMSVLAKWA